MRLPRRSGTRRGETLSTRAARRVRHIATRALPLALASALSVCLASQAQAAIRAPDFYGGPKVVEGDLLWWGADGVSLSTHGGTRLLVPGTEWSTVLVEGGWTAAAEPTRLEVGRTGGRLAAVRALRRCRAGSPEGWLEALAHGDLYTIVRASCLGRRPAQAQFLVRVRLSTGVLQAIARVPSGAVALAAAGKRLALTYETSGKPTGRVRVEVVDSSSAKLLYTVTAPSGEERRDRYERTEIDSAGDVLVSGIIQTPPPGPGIAFGWWGNARARVGRSLGETASQVASLSDGRIAYVTDGGGVEHIDVLNLATRKARTMVTFPGSARVLGVGLGKTRLAWAQQSYGYTPPATGGYPCVSRTSVGPTELVETPLSASGGPIVVKGASVPPAAGPLCPEM